MKRFLLIIFFLPLFISWIITVLLYLLLNKFYPAPIWNWKNIYLINGNVNLKFEIKDQNNSSSIIEYLAQENKLRVFSRHKENVIKTEAKLEDINKEYSSDV